jgi:ribosomal-protein-alanine N-acetyltransferase
VAVIDPHAGEVLNIRTMRSDDLEQVVAIDKMSFSMPWPISSYRYELFENPLSLLWVAEAARDGVQPRVIGMVVVWLVMDEAHIATIAVHPEYRGRGIAKDMLKIALDEVIRRGMHSATLEVRAGNIIAQRLYSRFGFQVVGRRPRYYRDNDEDALIMTVSGLVDTSPPLPF